MGEFWQGFWLAAVIFSSVGATIGIFTSALCFAAAGYRKSKDIVTAKG